MGLDIFQQFNFNLSSRRTIFHLIYVVGWISIVFFLFCFVFIYLFIYLPIYLSIYFYNLPRLETFFSFLLLQEIHSSPLDPFPFKIRALSWRFYSSISYPKGGERHRCFLKRGKRVCRLPYTPRKLCLHTHKFWHPSILGKQESCEIISFLSLYLDRPRFLSHIFLSNILKILLRRSNINTLRSNTQEFYWDSQ